MKLLSFFLSGKYIALISTKQQKGLCTVLWSGGQSATDIVICLCLIPWHILVPLANVEVGTVRETGLIRDGFLALLI